MSYLKSKIKAVYDIIPATSSSGLISDSKLSDSELNLRISNNSSPRVNPALDREVFKGWVSEANLGSGGGLTLDDIAGEIEREYTEETRDPQKHLETILNSSIDIEADLASIGAVISRDLTINGAELAMVPIVESEREDEIYKKVLAHIRSPISSTIPPQIQLASISPKIEDAPEGRILMEEVIPVLTAQPYEKESRLDIQVADFYNNKKLSNKAKAGLASFRPPVIAPKKDFNFSTGSGLSAQAGKKRFWKLWLVIFVVLGLLAYGLTLKNEIARDSGLALENLDMARDALGEFDFSGAAKSFNKSYDDFLQASHNLSLMGAGISGIFSNLPGFNKIESAKNLAEAGKLLAQSGKAMSDALASLSKTGSILNPVDSHGAKPLRILSDIKGALAISTKNFDKAKALISDIDVAVIPEDKKAAFGDFKDKLPIIEEYLADANGYADFLEGIIGIDKSKKYLLLFNNNSELRPIGGFPGTYGVVSFSSGGLSDFFVNDVYNLDGQLKRNIIPPRQLQHITPTWGMRDSAWFSDFPASARKTIYFFNQEAGYGVDGVIALNPDIVSGILKIVGSIKLPEYGLTLTADNFLEKIQEEVEYGDNRTQPKQVVADFAPRFLEKLYSADAEKWMKIFAVFMAGLQEKDIMFYFNDKSLEEFAVAEGFGGEIRQDAGDYLHINFSNVKGSKTDAVTDNLIDIDSQLTTHNGQSVVKNSVSIVRKHNGGDHEHGFYNRQNPAYVRVLIPENAELISISGNDRVNYKPLINYGLQSDFEKDRDLSLFESGFMGSEFLGVDRFEESEKTGIGFWMVVDPGTSKTVMLEYSVPVINKDYTLYFQKQPGMDWKNFKFIFKKTGDGGIITSSPALNRVGDKYIYEGELKRDLEIKIFVE